MLDVCSERRSAVCGVAFNGIPAKCAGQLSANPAPYLTTNVIREV